MVSILRGEDIEKELENYNKDLTTKTIKDILEPNGNFQYVKKYKKEVKYNKIENLNPKKTNFGMKSTVLNDYSNFSSEKRIFFDDGI
jgi:hypothetical protein